MRVAIISLLLISLPAFAEETLIVEKTNRFILFSGNDHKRDKSVSFGGELRLFGDKARFTPILRLNSGVDINRKPILLYNIETRVQGGMRWNDVYGIHSFMMGESRETKIYPTKRIMLKEKSVIFTYDGWINGPKNTSLGLYAHYNKFNKRVDLQFSPGIRLGLHEKFNPILGVESKHTFSPDYIEHRLGFHVTDYKIRRMQGKMSFGYMFTPAQKPSLYLSLSTWRVF
jgi:hypothetical protein